MWTYTARVTWEKDGKGKLESDGKPALTATPPSDFGGADDHWSPEELLAGSLGSCLMMAALFHVDRMKVDLRNYESTVTETMEKSPSGLAFTAMQVNVSAVVGSGEDAEKMKQAMDLAEKNCPVSGVIKCPIEVSLDCDVVS